MADYQPLDLSTLCNAGLGSFRREYECAAWQTSLPWASIFGKHGQCKMFHRA